MSIRSTLTAFAAAKLTSAQAEARRHARAETQRRVSGAPHIIDAFIDVRDPYSLLLAQLLPRLAERYAVTVQPWLVSAPDDAAAPQRALLAIWSLRDAAMLAARADLSAPSADTPGDGDFAAAEQRLAALLADAGPGAAPLDAIADVMLALWTGKPDPAGPGRDAHAAKLAGDARRAACGHYLGGVLAYGGECYWGVDRLHYLEARLTALGLARHDDPMPLYPPPSDLAGPATKRAGAPIDLFLSFRSPYTWLALERADRLAKAHGRTLNLRFVLPMVMRSLPVPREKRRYITMDAAREARRLGIAFGKIADPVGRPVERGYSLLPWARDQGRGIDYCIAFMRAVWSQGVDAGSDAGMRKVVTAAGLDWSSARTVIDNADWRAEAEANRAEMTALGLWGVPSLRVGDTAVWGQDRLWAIDAALRAAPQS